jgi:hypothetical protein
MFYFIVNSFLYFLPFSLLLIFIFYINIFIYKMINVLKYNIEKIFQINYNKNKNKKKLKNKIKLINKKMDFLLKYISENKIYELKSNTINSQTNYDNLSNKLNDLSYLNLSNNIDDVKKENKLTDNYELINNNQSNSILQNTLLELSSEFSTD